MSPEDDFNLILKQPNSNFIFYELPPGIYTVEDLSDCVEQSCDGTIQNEHDDTSMQIKKAVGQARRPDKENSSLFWGSHHTGIKRVLGIT